MAKVQLAEGVFWVGVVDWELRDFHGYSTERGTTYNSYLVVDEKVVLFDTVKKGFGDEHLERIAEILPPERIDFIVVDHVEMDHTGALPEVIQRVKPQKLFCSPKGKENLLKHFHREDWPYEVVKTGDTLKIGKRTIRFLETRMLHWPDSMFSWLEEDRILISQDAFGQHWATSQRFDDEVPQGELMWQAAKYYANILWPYSNLVEKLLKDVGEMGIEPQIIAPDHGLIWRRAPEKILEAYGRWGRHEASARVVIVYDTMWHSTEEMARAIARGLESEGVEHLLIKLSVTHRSDVVTELLEAGGLLVGSPTFNNGMLPTVADFLHYLKGLRPRGKKGAAFGSYGWSGEAVKLMEAELQAMKVEVLEGGLRVQFVPTGEYLERCEEFGKRVGKVLKESFGS
ncbi:MAG: FprA family A-type flavoprotein [Deltaproteobacteria bacterium]|nr:MAG: FprA family A-type flavoprotein [Deltaproteobacteria bacterium]